jgi:DNA-binding NarL/FixJ family response regulator
VVIADDDPAVRGALSELIVAHPELTLVGVADCGASAAEMCGHHRPTLAVVDVMMPGGGSEAIGAIHHVSPTTSVVVYTARSDRRTATRMLAAGADAVFVKGGPVDLAAELVAVARGGPLRAGTPDVPSA